MIPESPNIPATLKQEERFIFALRSELRRHAQEINKLSKNIQGIDLSNLSIDLSDYYTKEQTEQKVTELATALDVFATVEEMNEKYQTLLDRIDGISVDIQEDDWTSHFKINNGKLCQIT